MVRFKTKVCPKCGKKVGVSFDQPRLRKVLLTRCCGWHGKLPAPEWAVSTDNKAKGISA